VTNKPPPSLWGTLRRSIRFWFGLFFIVAALVMIPVVMAEKRTYEALVAKGQTTTATVVEHGETTDHDDKTSHWIRVRYRDQSSTEHTEDLAVPKKIHETFPIGSSLPVRFLREQPGTVKLETTLPEADWKDTRALTITLAVIGLMIVGLSMVNATRARRRRPRHVPAPAREPVYSHRS
jgi:hypothetical protein